MSWVPQTKKTPPQVVSPTAISSQRLMSSSPRSQWRSNSVFCSTSEPRVAFCHFWPPTFSCVWTPDSKMGHFCASSPLCLWNFSDSNPRPSPEKNDFGTNSFLPLPRGLGQLTFPNCQERRGAKTQVHVFWEGVAGRRWVTPSQEHGLCPREDRETKRVTWGRERGFSGFGPHPLDPEMDWPEKWIGPNWLAKVGPKWTGQLVKSGWPKWDWPKLVSSAGWQCSMKDRLKVQRWVFRVFGGVCGVEDFSVGFKGCVEKMFKTDENMKFGQKWGEKWNGVQGVWLKKMGQNAIECFGRTTEIYFEFTQESLTKQRFPEDFDYDDTIGQTLLTACRRRADCPVCLSSSMSHDRTGKLSFAVTWVTRKVTKFRDKTLKTNRSGLFWTDKGSKSSLTVKRRHESTNSRLIMTEEKHKNWMKLLNFSRKNFVVLLQENDVDKIVIFFMHRCPRKFWELREAHEKSLNDMEELKKLQSSTFDTIARRRAENQFTCLQRRKVEYQKETQIWDASPDRQPKIQSSSVEETFQRIMGQTNNDCRFRIFILTNSLREQPSLAGR